ncbi:hypothetical protein SAMN05443633_112100 [Chryseobacterium arachidis]|uniref:Nitrogen regulatory IIA protein n=1 Tax=Chryseobacterium arachidis TaxID=1416778 RepID=A0A1M5IDM3_9FLAO|nr:hypothetical protein [Chryseobacterium arachidis]SHG26372.1 hypothetical protein SAMN05443633_112100 [Chryseobacterium arachidis]
MKNFRKKIEETLEKLDLKWRDLPLKTQFRYVILLFGFYLIVGIGVLVKVCYDLGREEGHMTIEHINSSGVLKDRSEDKDSVLTNSKNSENGRERK